MKEKLIDIQNLTLVTNEQLLVEDLSISIHKSEIVGLVGESGSGKTISALSLLQLLPKNIKITSGSIFFQATSSPTKVSKSEESKTIDLLKLSSNKMNAYRGNKISMIFQEPMSSLNPSMRCGKQAMEALMLHKHLSRNEAKNEILKLFNEVKLPDPNRAFKAWPHELSGGQRQRVMIAMAISTSPDLLIADEPTTALDVTVQKSIIELLLELKNKYKMSMLFISHDLHVVYELADCIAVMYRGKLMEYGNKKEILEHPKTSYTKGLIACKPQLDTQAYRLPTISEYMAGNKLQDKEKRKIKDYIDRPTILEVDRLQVSYKNGRNDFTAVKNISFNVKEGETLGLVGESGCGKTSLGRAILQLIEIQSGLVKYKGAELNRLSSGKLRKIRKNIQIVFQDPYSSLNPGMTVGSIIAEPMQVHRTVSGKDNIQNSCIELLERVGLTENAMYKYPHQFSGGQRQRIGIARALACEPEFIILDESVSALDVSVQAQILNLLNNLKEDFNLTYIFISHDLTVVKYMADRMIVMSKGEIVEYGDADTIYASPQQAYTKTLISSIPGI